MKAQTVRNPGLKLCGLRLPNDGHVVSHMLEIIFPAETAFVIRSIWIENTDEILVEALYLPLTPENELYLKEQADNINKIFQLDEPGN